MPDDVLDSMLTTAGRELIDAAEERKLQGRIDMMNTSPRRLGPGSDLDELTAERDRVRGLLGDVDGQLLRLNSGGMGDAERSELRQRFDASDRDALQHHLTYRVRDLRERVGQLEGWISDQEPEDLPDVSACLDAAERAARDRLEALEGARARLSWRLYAEGTTALERDLRATETAIADERVKLERIDLARSIETERNPA